MTRDPNQSEVYRQDVPSNGEPGSVMKFLRQEQVRQAVSRSGTLQSHPHCVKLHRLQICTDEADDHHNETLPMSDGSGINRWLHSDFLTQNFRLAERGRRPKAMVHVDVADQLDLTHRASVHNPHKGLCPQYGIEVDWDRGGDYLRREKALFTAYHYPGTREQRTARSGDPRGSFEGGRKGTPVTSDCLGVPADDLRPWLKGFVDLLGESEAERLLDGVGRVHSWPKYSPEQE